MPLSLALASRTNIEPSAYVIATVFITGIQAPTTVTLTTNTDGHYQLFGESTTQTSGMVGNNTTITLSLRSMRAFDGVATALISVGGVTQSFMATTRAQDFTPNQFMLDPKTEVATGTIITSNVVMITGIDMMTTISIVGGSILLMAEIIVHQV